MKWDDLWANCDKVNAKFTGQFCLDLPFPNSQASFAYWSMMLNSACGEMYTPDLKQTAFNTPQGLAALEAFKKWASYADRGSFSLPGSYEASKRLAQGNLTTYSFGFSNEYKQFLTDPAESKIIGKIGFSLIPGNGDCVTGSYNGWEGYGINVNGDQAKKAAAYAYLDWLVNVPSQTEMSRNFGFLPVRKSLLANPPEGVGIPTWETAAAAVRVGQGLPPRERLLLPGRRALGRRAARRLRRQDHAAGCPRHARGADAGRHGRVLLAVDGGR